MKCGFVNIPETVIDEVAREKKSEEEDPGVMVRVFIHPCKPFRINNQYFHVVMLWVVSFQGLIPNPKSLSAWVNCWANFKPLVDFVKQNAVYNETFPCTVFAYYRNNT